MYYKIIFENPISYDSLNEIEDEDGNIPNTQFNHFTGAESVIYSNSQIDLILNGAAEIAGLQICNECIKTFNIENHLLHLTYKLLDDENSAELIDGNGFKDFLNKEALEEYL